MIHVERKNPKRRFAGYLLSFLLLAAILAGFYVFSGSLARQSGEEKLNALRDAVQRASIQCYAIEGRYPPSVEYLEEHYGISIDRDRYHVFYDGWASNIMPDITILPAIESQGGPPS